jgi:hypothetical protein
MSRKDKLQEIALVAEIVSGIAIVSSLIFVGIQLQQNNQSLQIAAYQSRVQEASGALVALALSEDMSALRLKLRDEGPEGLTELELDRLRNWNIGTILRAQAQYYQYQQGFLDHASVQGMIRNMARNYPSWKQLDIIDFIEIPELREEIEALPELRESD